MTISSSRARLVELLDRAQGKRIVVRGDRKHLELRRPAAKYVRHCARQALAETVVRNDQDTDHRGSLVATIGSGPGYNGTRARKANGWRLW